MKKKKCFGKFDGNSPKCYNCKIKVRTECRFKDSDFLKPEPTDVDWEENV